MHTFTVDAFPVSVEQHDGYSSVRFEIFSTPRVRDTITVSSPAEIGEALAAWSESHDLPVEDTRGEARAYNAWSLSLLKPARWPSGYKQAGERHHTFVKHVNA
jgi:hypothetical protein